MRNILVFPDGTKQPFMYPMNRDIEVGEKLQVELEGNRVDVLTIINIEKADKEIYYHLSF